MTTNSHARTAGEPNQPPPTIGVPAGPEWAPSRPSTHAHLWELPDGTGLHAAAGQLVRDPETGRLCCHLCGRWFASLGSHVRVHGYTAADYREAMGLMRGRRLVTDEISTGIARRQARAYRASPAVRARMAEGHELARSGQLAWRARQSNSAAAARPERLRQRTVAFAAGRASAQARREERLAARLVDLGATNLAGYLTTAYAAGASLEDLARATGLGRERLRQEVAAAGIAVRSAGHNTAAGKRSRARRAEATAADRVGTDDLRAWLADHHRAGSSLAWLAMSTGRSSPWVRSRLPESGRTTAGTTWSPP